MNLDRHLGVAVNALLWRGATKEESVSPDVLYDVLAATPTSIWSAVSEHKSARGVAAFVKSEKRRRLDEWLIRNYDSNRDNGSVTAALAKVAASRAATAAFCREARAVEDAIWTERGPEGETILHYALIQKNTDLLQYLLSEGPYSPNNPENALKPFDRLHLLINTVYEKHAYWGESPAHLAVVVFGDDTTILKLLIQKGADVFLPRARGTFFDRDERIGSFYMGETVLAFAAVMGHHKIVDYLIHTVGIDPNTKDYNENNVLHVLAWYGYVSNARGIDVPKALDQFNSVDAMEAQLPEVVASSDALLAMQQLDKAEDESVVSIKEIKVGHIYHQLESGIRPKKFGEAAPTIKIEENQYHPHRVDDTQSNLDKMTPLLVAVHRSQANMVEAILNYKSRTIWTYGSARRTRVCLSEIDTYNDSTIMNHSDGALAMAIRNQNIDILNIPVFKALLRAKWILYAQRIFTFRFYANLLYMFIFSVALALLPNGVNYMDPNANNDERLYNYKFPDTPESVFRLVCEVFLLFSNLYMLYELLTQARLLKRKVFTGFSRNHTLLKYLNLVIFLVIVVFRVARWNAVETVGMTLYAVVGWLQMLYYFRGFRELGPLTTVFTTIVNKNVTQFLMILSIVLAGFGSALWLQMAPFGALNAAAPSYNSTTIGTLANSDDTDWKSLLPGGLIWGLRLFFSQGSYDDFRDATSVNFAIILFMCFFFAVNIILINVFIGMVNSTFQKVLQAAEDRYYFSWASLIIEIDELLLAKHAIKAESARERGERVNPPLTRIGIPRLTKVVNERVEEEKKRHNSQKLSRHLSQRGSFTNPLEGLIRRIQTTNAVEPERDQSQKSNRQGSNNDGVPNRNNSTLMERKKDGSVSGYYDYDLYLQFNGNDATPKHIVASLDQNSPLSEIGRENISTKKVKRVFEVQTRRTKKSSTFKTS
ncbi:Transient receptor putative cation channel sub V member 1 [Rhizoclosmatium sp. JEL0117]|nr:Transient receptor putative cation channel sub V member 1 [Rhizoclosmatium sp. JEL0117]